MLYHFRLKKNRSKFIFERFFFKPYMRAQIKKNISEYYGLIPSFDTIKGRLKKLSCRQVLKPARENKFSTRGLMTKRRITLTLTALFIAFQLVAQTRLGLHVTQEELSIWRDRANNGPYKASGDVQTNSPGDWNRIAANATAFKGTSTDSTKRISDRFKYWTGTGCYPTGSTYEPKIQGELLKDAAFYCLIKQDNANVAKLKYEILRIVRDAQLDFSNTSRWCSFYDSNPGFAITQWITRVMFAYDYLRIAGKFTSNEQTEISGWFKKAGVKFSKELDNYYNKRFTDRPKGNYTLTSYSTGAEANTSTNKKYPLYYGGPQAGFLGQGYNNRMGTISRFVAMAGVLTNDVNLQANAKRYFFEWMRYGVYPNGEVADLSRCLYSTSEPERGLLYVFCLVQAMSDVAEVFARTGDPSLYNYSTEDGYYGSQSPGNPKTLLKVIRATQNYLNGSHKRYASFSATTDTKLLINGIDPYENPGEITFDNWFSLANRFYKSSEVMSNYLRQANGCRPYPSNPRGTGPNHPWSGQAGIYPATLFMFGKLEGKVWPYPASGNQAPTVSITSPSSSTSVTAGSNITLSADAADANGSVTKVEFFQGSTSLGVDDTAPYSIVWSNLSAGSYTLKVVATDNANASTSSSTVSITVNAATAAVTSCTASGTILRELWTGVEGKAVSSIPVSKTPNSKTQLSLFESPSNDGDQYGQRIRGYICPPNTGNYLFWIASDDDGELWLSTDDNPANKKKIAYIQDLNATSREWDKYSSQQSASIYLQSGKRYYIEALHKEGWGGDNLAVGWQLPNGTQERPIPGSRLSPFETTSSARVEMAETRRAELAEKTMEVFAYPNPFRDVLTLEWNEVYTENFTLHVTDALGNVLFRREYPADAYRTMLEIDLRDTNLAHGMYFLQIESLKAHKVIKLRKE
jgi:hypothetical protein